MKVKFIYRRRVGGVSTEGLCRFLVIGQLLLLKTMRPALLWDPLRAAKPWLPLRCRLTAGGGAVPDGLTGSAAEQLEQAAQAMGGGARGMDLAAKMMQRMGWKEGKQHGSHPLPASSPLPLPMSPPMACQRRHAHHGISC